MKNVWGVTLFVSNLERAVAFYEKTLGLNKKYQYSSYAGFDCGGVEIGLIPKENMKHEEDAPIVELIVDNVNETYRTLRAKGVKFVKDPHDETWVVGKPRFWTQMEISWKSRRFIGKSILA